MEYDIYQIVSINAEGETVEVFALPAQKRLVQKNMVADYGNVEVTGMSFEDAPEEIVAQIKASNTSVID